ncbi:predicted protein [Sclerotinia sclerotiorum 1980 UF-70]|uniref:Uncharacterized protein n=1 Tax=Sclerotinia sclerotiorum (strain ATCC 18683 / 1980 / Ss-1) TaxID=665079 RepID=A7EFW2_SCLS1|nr:predicted protein [Sclerotinia sclerotiorum 1980 UF-70]EDO01728.1 predicted protein [Sclerotinia sclerotiorum 1980 UF-70]
MAIINLRRPTDSPMCVVKLRNTAMQWHDRHEYISAMSFLEERTVWTGRRQIAHA